MSQSVRKVVLYTSTGEVEVIKQVTAIQKKRAANFKEYLILTINGKPPRKVKIGKGEKYTRYVL